MNRFDDDGERQDANGANEMDETNELFEDGDALLRRQILCLVDERARVTSAQDAIERAALGRADRSRQRTGSAWVGLTRPAARRWTPRLVMIGLVAAVLCALVLTRFGVSGSSAPTGPSPFLPGHFPPSWTTQRTPTVSHGKHPPLTSVSCPVTTWCMAVGYMAQAGTPLPVITAEAESWNGVAWSLVPIPAPNGAQLYGVSCTSTQDCTAVGSVLSVTAGQTTLAEHWDGSSWRIEPAPAATRNQVAVLRSVSCTSPSSCIAVGNWSGSGPQGPLAERWDGNRWTVDLEGVPQAGGMAGIFTSVSCSTAGSCVAVGDEETASPGSTSPGFLAEVGLWNGSHWTVQPLVVPGTSSSELVSVSCTSPSSCVAVGTEWIGRSGGSGLGSVWNGSSWSSAPTPDSGEAVSCFGPVECTAVSVIGSAGTEPISDNWDGREWLRQPMASPKTAGLPDAIDCLSSGACTAVGGSVAERRP